MNKIALTAGVLLSLMTLSSSQARELDAELRWSQLTEMGFAVSGVVEKVFVQAGQPVKQGRPLARLEQHTFQARLKAAQAAEAAAQLSLQEADKELERAEELYDRTVLSDHELLQARAAQAKAASELQRAQASHIKARQKLAYSELKAPFDARVLQVKAAEAQASINRFQSQPVVMLAEQQAMIAQASVSAAEARSLKPGQAVKVMLGKRRYSGEVVAIVTDEQNHHFLQVRFTTKDEMYFAGEKASISY